MIEYQGRVLLVDDDRQTRLKLTRDLEGGGFAVSQAAGGRAALDMLQSESFDLVLLDLLMPEVDGYGVLAEMKADEKTRDIPVVIISAVENRENVEKCMRLGAKDYLTKPVDAATLNASVSKSLED
jgi:CheY-like chemotaxis protein